MTEYKFPALSTTVIAWETPLASEAMMALMWPSIVAWSVSSK